MIPQEQLQFLKPLPDQVKRAMMVRKKRQVSYKKGRLTKRARQWACYIATCPTPIKYPSGEKWKGNLPMSERKKKK